MTARRILPMVLLLLAAADVASAEELPALAVPAGATNALAILPRGGLLVGGATLALLDGTSGRVRWTRPLKEPITCAVGLDDEGRFLTATRRHVQVHAVDGSLEDEWSPLGEQAWITSLAVGSNRVFVCDAGQRAVWRYEVDGRLLARLPPASAVATTERFSIPSPCFDVVFAAGSFWVVNPGNHEIRRYSPDGDRLGGWGHFSMSDPAGFVGCCNPIHLAATPDGGFVTAEKGVPRLKRYDASGVLRSVVANAESFARGRVLQDMAVDPQGRIYVLDGERLRVFLPE